MTKQDYIQTKTREPLKVIYKYYTEKFDHKKHKPFLNENEFYTYIQMVSDLNTIAIKVFNHYDKEFEVTTLLDKDGNIITFF